MPTAQDYKKARALPATPAGPGRPVAGAICHTCGHVCASDHTHGPLHPADYNWAEPRLSVPRPRLRKNRGTGDGEPHHPPSPVRQTNQVVPDEHQDGRCPCRPWLRVLRSNGRKKTTWVHNRATCPWHAKRFDPSLFREHPKMYQEPDPKRHPKLPPPLSLYLYHKLLKAGAQLVLCYYEADTGRKRPIYKNWQRLRPDFAEVCRHLAAHPNNLIGVVPASAGAVVLDVDYGDWKALAEHLGSAATSNRTLRPKGRHIWIPADPKGKTPTNSGFNFQDLAAGDVRHQSERLCGSLEPELRAECAEDVPDPGRRQIGAGLLPDREDAALQERAGEFHGGGQRHDGGLALHRAVRRTDVGRSQATDEERPGAGVSSIEETGLEHKESGHLFPVLYPDDSPVFVQRFGYDADLDAVGVAAACAVGYAAQGDAIGGAAGGVGLPAGRAPAPAYRNATGAPGPGTPPGRSHCFAPAGGGSRRFRIQSARSSPNQVSVTAGSGHKQRPDRLQEDQRQPGRSLQAANPSTLGQAQTSCAHTLSGADFPPPPVNASPTIRGDYEP